MTIDLTKSFELTNKNINVGISIKFNKIVKLLNE